ncbi:MAG: hypothetical protein ACFB0D_00990 [Phormidesmis sp.]
MSQNVTQWLAEIQSLQRQVHMLQQEREQAYNSVKSWRDLYEGEAKQRQRDAAAHSRKLAQLESELKDLKATDNLELDENESGMPQSASTPRISSPQLQADIDAIKSIQSAAQLQAQLIATKQQYEQLKHQLKAEQEEHEQTRESLTAALGDAVDLLAKERLPKSDGGASK